MKLISACLCGFRCKYHGGHNLVDECLDLLSSGNVIPVCPEQLGGLPTPRSSCEIRGGSGADVLSGHARVFSKDGQDVTEYFVRGAQEVLKMAQILNINEAILKSRSPSCGAGVIYDGSFSGCLIAGDGVTSALLKANGIKITDELEFISAKDVK